MYEASGKYHLGNYLTMMTNLLYYVETTGESVFSSSLYTGIPSFHGLGHVLVRKATHNWLMLEIVDSENTDRIRQIREKVTRSDVEFFDGTNISFPSLPTDSDRRRLIHTYLSRFFPSPLPTLPDSCLVIHIRSGDIFAHNFHCFYIQPPLAYYTHILDTHPEYTNVLLVTESDQRNPVITALRDRYPERVTIQSSSVEKDVQLILSAKHLVVGTGTFGAYLALSSMGLRRLFCFERHNVWYPNAPYEILVKGVVNQKYPLQWSREAFQNGTMTREDYIVETLDPSTFQYEPKLYWNAGIRFE
jgi:hypothetical protein